MKIKMNAALVKTSLQRIKNSKKRSKYYDLKSPD